MAERFKGSILFLEAWTFRSFVLKTTKSPRLLQTGYKSSLKKRTLVVDFSPTSFCSISTLQSLIEPLRKMPRQLFSSYTIGYLLLLLAGRSVSQSCWYPDHQTQAQADVPCDPNADVSACCGPNAFCLSNGLCYIDGTVSRGSCTDKNWGPECANVCTDGKSSR